MKNTSLFLTSVLAGLVAMTFPAHAADWTTTSGAGNWTDTANWAGGILPTAGGTANLTATLTGSTTAILPLDNSATAGILNIASGNGYLMQVNGNGSQLIMDNGGSQAQINIGQTGASNNYPIMAVDIRMTAGGLAITENNDFNHIISGAISSNAAGNQTLVFSRSGANNFTIQSNISDGSGKVAVVVDSLGGGIMNITEANSTFSGGLLLRNGILGGSGYGTGLITLGDASTTGTLTIRGSGTATISNDILVANYLSSCRTYLQKANTATNTTFTGDIEIQKDIYLQNDSGPLTVSLTGNISGSGRINMYNEGTKNSFITLSGNNTHTGGIWLYTGNTNGNSTLTLGHEGALGTGTFRIVGAGKAYLDSSVADLVLTTNSNITMDQSFTYLGTGGNKLNLGNGTVTFSGNKDITVNGGVLTIGGAIVGGSNLTKLGAGTLALNGANTYTGDTTVSAGTLRGTGSVDAGLYVASGATFEAGNSIGTFTVNGETGFLELSTYNFELNSTLGTSDLLVTNGLSFENSNVTLSLADLGGGAWTGNSSFVIMNNTSGDAISGTFSGYAEGADVIIGANTFTISYVGGTGNDVILTVVPEPATVALMLTALGTLALTRRRRQS